MVVLTSLAAVAALSLAAAPAVRADDGKHESLTRLASVDGGADLSSRLGLPARKADFAFDLKVLLAQNGPPARTDVANGDDTILVALASTVPQSVEEDIAAEYGLKLVERTQLPDLGLRIVQFRALGNRTIESILGELRADDRVRRAQRNAQYGLPPQGPLANEVLAAKKAPGFKAAVRPRPDRSAVVASVSNKRVDPTSGHKHVPARADRPGQVGNVADVLSGGL